MEIFTIITGMLIPSFQKMRTGKIPYSSFKVQLYFPIQGTEVVVKKISPFAALPLMGKFFFTTPARLSWGNKIVPFVTHKEFFIPILAALPLV